jgi:acetylornithine/N-succinyldiaminopimelate aminotransferase
VTSQTTRTTDPGAVSADWRSRWRSTVMDTYGTPELVLASGRGTRVFDVDGREYLDLVGGIAVNVLGHAHPAVVEAVSRQVATLGHTSNLVVNRPAVELAERLLALLGRDGRVFFCNSGAEANEAALKLTRRTGRTRIVAAEGSFHGRTTGALAVTGQPAKRSPFEPLLPGPAFVPYGDVAALRAATDATTAAVVLEPVLGEGGVVVPPDGYLAEAGRAAADAGALLVVDEVQTGVGRTGAWFGHQHDAARPDVVTLAKGLGGGLPVGACVALGDAAGLLSPGQHGSTFGGNPVVCAAALAVLDAVERDDLLGNAQRQGAAITTGVRAMAHPLVADVRGRGLLVGIVLAHPAAKQVEAALRDRGILVNAVQPDVLRLAPALLLSDGDVAELLDRLPAALAAVLDDLERAQDEEGVPA